MPYAFLPLHNCVNTNILMTVGVTLDCMAAIRELNVINIFIITVGL